MTKIPEKGCIMLGRECSGINLNFQDNGGLGIKLWQLFLPSHLSDDTTE